MIYIALYLFIGLVLNVIYIQKNLEEYRLEAEDTKCELGRMFGELVIIMWFILMMVFWPIPILEAFMTDKRNG